MSIEWLLIITAQMFERMSILTTGCRPEKMDFLSSKRQGLLEAEVPFHKKRNHL